MLVLTRKTNESIIIGDQIVVTVVEVRGDQVKIGISAPAQVPIHRREVWEEIKKGNVRATAKPTDMERAVGVLGLTAPKPQSETEIRPQGEPQPQPGAGAGPQRRLVPGNRGAGDSQPKPGLSDRGNR